MRIRRTQRALRLSRACRCGADTNLSLSSEIRAIDRPPYYAIATYPVLLNTQGGPRRDEYCRVLRPDGTPLPGLFSAGELGSIWNRLYPGTGNISECLVTGRIAADAALRQFIPGAIR